MNVEKVTGDVVTETGKIAGKCSESSRKIANNIKDKLTCWILFNDKLRRKAGDEFLINLFPKI